jgi:hypothetical protein
MHRRLLFRVASNPSVAKLRPIQVVADIRSCMYEFEAECRIERLRPTQDGVTLEVSSVAFAEADALAAMLGQRYPDVNITIVWHEPVPASVDG